MVNVGFANILSTYLQHSAKNKTASASAEAPLTSPEAKYAVPRPDSTSCAVMSFTIESMQIKI